MHEFFSGTAPYPNSWRIIPCKLRCGEGGCGDIISTGHVKIIQFIPVMCADSVNDNQLHSALTPSIESDALTTLTAQFLSVEKRKNDMARVNVLVRRSDVDGLLRLGYSKEGIDALFNPEEDAKEGYTRAEFNKLSAEMKRLKLAISALNASAGRCAKTEQGSGYEYVESVEMNHLIFRFSSKPEPEFSDLLARHGFKLNYEAKEWRRLWTVEAIYAANYVRGQLDKLTLLTGK